MKNKIFLLTVLLLIPGCGTIANLRRASHPVAYAQTMDDQYSAPPAKKTYVPATRAAATSPVAATAAHIVRLAYAAGFFCLILCGVAAYLGQIIPAVKLGLAGVALPIAATWFNYHYGLVIAGMLVSSALGFLWSFSRRYPGTLSRFENEAFLSAKDFAVKLEKKI